MPVTTPVAVLTVAMAVLPLLHVAPAVAVLSVVVRPVHKVVLPVIAAGIGFTVTVAVLAQPVPSE